MICLVGLFILGHMIQHGAALSCNSNEFWCQFITRCSTFCRKYDGIAYSCPEKCRKCSEEESCKDQETWCANLPPSATACSLPDIGLRVCPKKCGHCNDEQFKRRNSGCRGSGINCADLPTSMNGERDNRGHPIPKGCPGAVWRNGDPSQRYCNGDGYNGERFPWWKECCEWTGEKCAPKINCEDLPSSMNGEKDNNGRSIPKGCPGAVWRNGDPSQRYCNGDGYNGERFPWWKECCTWSGEKCAPKIICEDLPTSMNGEKDNNGRPILKGCPGAVWRNGDPSQRYCNGDGYNGERFPWWKECCKWTGERCAPKG